MSYAERTASQPNDLIWHKLGLRILRVGLLRVLRFAFLRTRSARGVRVRRRARLRCAATGSGCPHGSGRGVDRGGAAAAAAVASFLRAISLRIHDGFHHFGVIEFDLKGTNRNIQINNDTCQDTVRQSRLLVSHRCYTHFFDVIPGAIVNQNFLL